MKYKLLIILILALHLNAYAQDFVVDADKNHKETVKTVMLYPAGFELDKPVISLSNMENALQLEFDILGSEAPYLHYTYVHCDHKWQPDGLQKHQYINGFQQNELLNYEFSLNTYVDYVHFETLLPTDDMMPALSGNYMLVVFGEDEDDIYFTRRFCVLDDNAAISATMPRYPFDLGLGKENQEMDIEISYPDMFNNRPDDYSFVTIQQNGRWDNAVVGLKPTYIYPEKLSYINNEKTVFESGNQYLRINTSNFDTRPEKTRTVYREDDYYIVTLYHDTKRNIVTYTEEQDICGMMSIYLEKKHLDSRIEGDYARVDFVLDWPDYMIDKDVHILGAITDWRLDENSKMDYDFEEGCYKKSLMLKQGYYDYMYVVKDRETGKTTLEPVNGNFWETDNLYTVYLYVHDPNLIYDQLIGYQIIRSHGK